MGNPLRLKCPPQLISLTIIDSQTYKYQKKKLATFLRPRLKMREVIHSIECSLDHHEGLGSVPGNCIKKLDVVVYSCNPRTRKEEIVDL